MPHVEGDDYRQSIEVLAGGGYEGAWGSYVAPGNPYTVGSLYNPVSEPPRPVPPPPIFPTVRIIDPSAEGDSATSGTDALPSIVVDPEQGQTTTVFEREGAPYVAERTRETDWDYVYEQYVILNAPEEDVAFHGSIDWGEAVGTILGGVLDPFGVGQYARAALAGPTTVTGVPALGQQTSLTPARTVMATGTGCPPLGPKYAKICLATNEITPLRRRRRRRLLTSSDIKDLAALKAIVGGAALQGAVVQAIRR